MGLAHTCGRTPLRRTVVPRQACSNVSSTPERLNRAGIGEPDGHNQLDTGAAQTSIPLDWVIHFVPALHSTPEHGHVVKALFRKDCRRAPRALLSSSNSYYRPSLDVSQLSHFF